MSKATDANPDLMIALHKEAQPSQPEAGLTRRILAYNDKLLLAEHRMEKGWVGSTHSHPHDQVVYVAGGRITVTCDGRTFEVAAGDTFLVRGGVEHGAAAAEESIVIDVFTPCREDYIRR